MKQIISFFTRIFLKKQNNQEVVEMFKGITRLSQLDAGDVMVPRVDIEAIDASSTPLAIFKQIAGSTYSRFPVYKETIDSIVGIVYVKDLLKHARNLKMLKIEKIYKMHPPFFIPEITKLDKLLRDMRKKQTHIAIVVDEYGGVSGVVSMEDILEEIIGDIRDEFDIDEIDEYQKIQGEENTYAVEGKITIAKCNEKLFIELPDTEADTVGGFVYNLFGHAPKKNDKKTVKIGSKNISFKVLGMEGNRIKSIKINTDVFKKTNGNKKNGVKKNINKFVIRKKTIT